jgi:hypothetical protein
MDPKLALTPIPVGLRNPLINEYQSIIQNYAEHRWSPSELSGGKFCEIVFTILDGHAKSSFQAAPQKPRDFVTACKSLEKNSHVPRSFQILIPRLLPALYEIRNQRGVGHAGGDVDPNHMDAMLVISTCNWIMAELVRVFHGLTIEEAQSLVDSLSERRVPLVWRGENVKRVLDTALNLKDQILVLVASSASKTSAQALQNWTDYKNRTYFTKTLRDLHSKRLIEFSEANKTVEILPPGSKHVSELLAKRL